MGKKKNHKKKTNASAVSQPAKKKQAVVAAPKKPAREPKTVPAEAKSPADESLTASAELKAPAATLELPSEAGSQMSGPAAENSANPVSKTPAKKKKPKIGTVKDPKTETLQAEQTEEETKAEAAEEKTKAEQADKSEAVNTPTDKETVTPALDTDPEPQAEKDKTAAEDTSGPAEEPEAAELSSEEKEPASVKGPEVPAKETDTAEPPEEPPLTAVQRFRLKKKQKKKRNFFVRLLLAIWWLIKFVIISAILCALVIAAVAVTKLQSYIGIAEEKFNGISESDFLKTTNTIIYDADGKIISEMNEIIYEYLPVSETSEYVYNGYIAAEDERFLEHKGVDYLSIVRAAIEYVRHNGEITQGGSTITQQLIKNNVLSSEKTFDRKITEMFVAYMFEQEHTKDEIMEFYLNTNFYGNNCYGIEAASKYYFGKPSKDLFLPEAAMLVAISKSGTLYNPRTHYSDAKGRQEYVLSRMFEEGYITEKQYEYAKKVKLDFVLERPVVPTEKYMTSFAIYSAAIDLMEQEGFDFRYVFEDRDEMRSYQSVYQNRLNELMADIRKGGYEIWTSLRPDMQAHVQEIVDDVPSRYPELSEESGKLAFQGSAVVVNNKTGFVEAIIGGRGTDDDFNRGYLAKRQPGSSIKPIAVYTPAFVSGFYYPSFTLIDRDDPDDEYWPKNVTEKNVGQMSLREAIVQSTNTIAYQIMKAMQPRYAIGYLEKLKYSSLAPEDNYSYAIALGGFTYGVSPFEQAKAYSTLANLGEYIDNNCILKIAKQGEGVIFTEDSGRYRVYSQDAAYLMIDCCKGYLRQNYMTRRAPKNAICFAKTGTTNSAKDVWFCGGSTYYSCAVWLGYDMPRETNLKSSGLPADIWCRIMSDLHEELEKEEFERPETVISKSIDWKGDPVSYRTGRTDLFSDGLLQKARESDVFLGIILTDEDRHWKPEEEEEEGLDENGDPTASPESGGNTDGSSGTSEGNTGGESENNGEPVYVPEIPPWIIPDQPPVPVDPAPAPAPVEPMPAPSPVDDADAAPGGE